MFSEIGHERDVSTGDEDIETETIETGMHCTEPFDDGLSALEVAKNECRDAISAILDAAEVPADCLIVEDAHSDTKIILTIDYSSKVLYKSTLVSKLNGNPYLSKERLTQIKNSIYLKNTKDYLSALHQCCLDWIAIARLCLFKVTICFYPPPLPLLAIDQEHLLVNL